MLKLALAAALACLLFAACGTDEEAEPQPFSADSLPKEDRATRIFRRRFQQVCAAADRALAQAELEEFGAPGPDNPPPTRAELQRFYEEVVVPTRRGELETLVRIEPPSDLDEAVAAYLAELDAATTALAADLALIRDPGLEETAFTEADAAADAAGLPRCGSRGATGA